MGLQFLDEAHVSLADPDAAKGWKECVVPLGSYLVNPAVVDARLMVVAHGGEPPIAYLPDRGVLDQVLTHR